MYLAGYEEAMGLLAGIEKAEEANKAWFKEFIEEQESKNSTVSFCTEKGAYIMSAIA